MTKPRYIVSLHDVMPETLPRCREIVKKLQGWGWPPIQLLIVPGRAWDREGLNQIAEWQAVGHELVAHGWFHEIKRFRNLGHRFHSIFISANVAEHLEHDTEGIVSLMHQSSQWFVRHGFGRPEHYVPPAWALGKVPPGDLCQLPYQTVEIIRGYLHTGTASLEPMGLLGFEVRSCIKTWFIRQWNKRQLARGQRIGQPVRISLHPYDFDLNLKHEAIELLKTLGSRFDK